jgi:hypothetical protein
MALFLLRRDGWSLAVTPKEVKEYDIEVSMRARAAAVQIRNQRAGSPRTDRKISRFSRTRPSRIFPRLFHLAQRL